MSRPQKKVATVEITISPRSTKFYSQQYAGQPDPISKRRTGRALNTRTCVRCGRKVKKVRKNKNYRCSINPTPNAMHMPCRYPRGTLRALAAVRQMQRKK